MATPKGMHAQRFPVNPTDAVHIYSDDTHIWLQLRRDVPTENAIGKPTFKTAFCLMPGTAQQLGQKLQELGIRNQEKQKAKSRPQK